MSEIVIVEDATPPKALAPVRGTSSLIEAVIEKGLPVEVLERMINLKNQEEARIAKTEFDRHFAEMQADFRPVPRRKTATNAAGKAMYKYTPIEDILGVNGAVIAKHGFSYKWREEDIPNGRRFVIMISGWGHTEETSFDVPQLDKNQMVNSAQVAASMSTYGRRYTLVLGFGFVIIDEDDDAGTVSDAKPQGQKQEAAPAGTPSKQGERPAQKTPDERLDWPVPKVFGLFAEFLTPLDERGQPVTDWVYSDAEVNEIRRRFQEAKSKGDKQVLLDLYDELHPQLVERKKAWMDKQAEEGWGNE